MKSVFKDKKALRPSGKIEIIYRKKKVSPPYNALHLQGLLKERAKRAFKPKVYKNINKNGVLSKCAYYYFYMLDTSSGDPKFALTLLRKTGEIADIQGKTTITLNDWRSAWDTLRYNPAWDKEWEERGAKVEASKYYKKMVSKISFKPNRYLEDIKILLKAVKRLLKRNDLKIPIHKTIGGITHLIAVHHVVPIRRIKEEIKNMVHNKPDDVIEAAFFQGEIFEYENNIGLVKGSRVKLENEIIKHITMSKLKLLFICNQNLNRSKTAEEIFKSRFETHSRGLYNADSVKENDLEWADIIVVMEEQHRERIAETFPEQYVKKRIICLDVYDLYSYKQPELAQILKKKMNSFFTKDGKLKI